MFLFRLLLLFFLGLLLRRIWLSFTRPRKPRQDSSGAPGSSGTGERTGQGSNHSPITEQKIDDADFEEIP